MDHLNRRRLLQGIAAGALNVGALDVGSASPASAAARAQLRAKPSQTVTLTTTVAGLGSYARLPFSVPRGVQRLDVSMSKSDSSAALGIGLFDARGAGYQSEGFRGIYGEERSSFFVSASGASTAFVPGPIQAGTWTVLIPVFRSPRPTQVTVRVVMSFAPQGPVFSPGPEPGVVLDAPGWYRGDLHCHTDASSDAWSSGSSMTPAEWAGACRKAGLDFVAMTDHNVISQNYFLARDAGADMLLMPGEEMTNWFHGHATVSGMDLGQWLDFRQTPLALPLPTGGARISEFIQLAESMGAYVAAAHPLGAHLSWQFAADGEVDPRSRTHGHEVWTGPWQADDELSLSAWDTMLTRGWRTVANGGSDLHGVDNSGGNAVGKPTTIVYAEQLSKSAVIKALKAGRCFITRAPDGVELYLSGSRPGQAAFVGGDVYGAVGDQVTVTARVRRGGGMRLTFVSAGAPVQTVPLSSDDQSVEITVPIPPGGGYVRAEVRGQERPVIGNPAASEGDMEAITNPVFLTVGDLPNGYIARTAPVPDHPGPRRAG
ncbi:CehA/McbA family metallohydrolase [Terrabacter carboxydivorans]|uniref:CehA/McbA family metallohydrolase n=1 Tax=Terrabacter carboxydivorans TaxID=619730 RepID=A0ABP5ZTZ3_9MICO